MRLRFLLLAAFLPLGAGAQTGTPAAAPKPAVTTELAFNVGHAPDNVYDGFGAGGYLRGALSLLRSRGNFQYGITVEGGTNSWDYWYLAPGLVANYRSARPSYWYGGAMAGYNCSGDMLSALSYPEQKLLHGYVFGLQSGYVQRLGKRLALSGELAVRSSQLWDRRSDKMRYQPETVSILYFPMTIGLRYSFR